MILHPGVTRQPTYSRPATLCRACWQHVAQAAQARSLRCSTFDGLRGTHGRFYLIEECVVWQGMVSGVVKQGGQHRGMVSWDAARC